jgi:hypothetical protein
MALGLVATTAATLPPRRLIVVVARPNDPRAAQQHAERDVVVQDITPKAAHRDRLELGVDESAVFEVLLVGKDGQVKLRREQPVATSEITALIDTMPMRRNEMRAVSKR